MTIEISKGHLEAVLNYLTWRNKAQLHFRRFMQAVQPMPLNERFWQLLDHFRELVRCCLDRKHSEPIAAAAREFFRLALVAEPPLERDQYPMEEALQWFQGYKALKCKLDKALAGLYDFHGDSFGDLIDSMPLGGRALCERALKSASERRDGFLNAEEVTDAIDALPQPWSKLVSDEIYVTLTLEESGRESLVSWIQHNVITQEQGEQIESSKLD
jgi:hypothetical protein